MTLGSQAVYTEFLRQVLHATPNLQSTLRHIHHLLKPTGRFLLHEISPGT